MCGIFGIIVSRRTSLGSRDVFKLFEAFGAASQTRGREGSGVLASMGGQTYVHRSPDAFDGLVRSNAYRGLLARIAGERAALERGALVIGHARLATHGSQGVESNNQPVGYEGIYCLHNGIVVNAPSLWGDLAPLQPRTEVDSEVISALVAAGMQAGHGFAPAVRSALSRLDGEFSVALADGASGDLALATNNGSLYYAVNAERGVLVFASERYIVRTLVDRHAALIGGDLETIQVPLGQVVVIGCEELTFDASEPKPATEAPSTSGVTPRGDRLELHDTLIESAQRCQSLRRCTRCVLPETMPFINFDEGGVCSYCRNYRPKQLLGEDKLEQALSRFRSRDGSPDCVIAFSGGRDSSYALHVLKRRYGMRPIAYTYDWGMVTDLARRNQARMCGKLAVEHIWISADIGAKRRNIGANVKAWMHKPDLGMIPLFMAGDKQFFYYGHRTMKNTGIRLMVFATNHYEKTDFKIGFCGVPPVTDQGRPNYLNLGRKLALLRYYLWQFLRNPRYLNRSIPDTFGAFLSYYALDNEATFLHLYDYIPWNEEEIDRTLIGEYDWETARDSTSTWRIGDGTAALYNYIYRTICGFSEQETFRSNQIREGVITREQALSLVEQESVPRFESIQEYCGLIGVPFSELLSSIYRLQRLY
jgi:glutamine---fructose-6-phosphate transaminase (isomerizing)